MYVMVEHEIRDPKQFWSKGQELIPEHLPEGLVLHQSFPTGDGTHAVCIWEAGSVEALRAFFDTAMGEASVNHYHRIENRDGVAVPPAFAATPQRA